MRVDDGVPDLEVDALGLGKQVLQDGLVDVVGSGNGGPPRSRRAISGRPLFHVCR
jgi:hypothetical protein